ncbi:MAG: ASCH domain-containing protein [Chloracidobacterium sp.]|nr:ASCH domain-containing protein [Chloracidobacterium sp.]
MPYSVEEFWAEFCNATGVSPNESYQVWYFGNTPEMALELGKLVLSGKKFATASLAAVNEIKPNEAPMMGGYSVVTNFRGFPLAVIRTTEIRHLPFAEVDAQFAADEGEGDQSLEYWRDVHTRYFTREAAELGIEFSKDSIVCCERFTLLYPK